MNHVVTWMLTLSSSTDEELIHREDFSHPPYMTMLWH